MMGPTRSAIILFIVAIVSTVLLVAVGTSYALFVAHNNSVNVQKQISASCDFWKQLGGFPIKPVPPVKVPSKFGVQIVLSSLESYDGFGCGHLAPTPELIHWANYYHLPVP